MTDLQTRLLSSALGMIAGAILCTTDNVNINIGLGILIVCTVLFVFEYFRAQKI
ncbi:MAG TPA: hypothetical protein VJZ78_03250 [Anaerolineales bacterium]|nr:hypothetical protein [Anaerolineales bacterium]